MALDPSVTTIAEMVQQYADGRVADAVAAEQAASQQIIDGLEAQVSDLTARLDACENPAPPPPADPWAGLLYGANNGHFDQLNGLLDGKLQVRRIYEGRMGAAPSATVKAEWVAGRVPWVSFSGAPTSDSDAAAFFAACTKRTIVTFLHEVDHGPKMAPDSFRKIMEQLHAVKEESAPDPSLVRVGPVLMGSTYKAGSWLPFMPAAMDFIGIDAYCNWRPDGTGNKWDFDRLVGSAVVDYAKDGGLPLAIGEYGAHPDPADLAGWRPGWLQRQDEWMKANGAFAACYFHSPLGARGPWWLDRTHVFTTDQKDPARQGGDPDPYSVAAYRALLG